MKNGIIKITLRLMNDVTVSWIRTVQKRKRMSTHHEQLRLSSVLVTVAIPARDSNSNNNNRNYNNDEDGVIGAVFLNIDYNRITGFSASS